MIQAKRARVHARYVEALAPYADELDFQLMRIPEGRDPAYHLFYVLLSHRDRRNDVLESMRKRGVQATFHYQPLHASDAGRSSPRSPPTARSPTTSAVGCSGCRSTTI